MKLDKDTLTWLEERAAQGYALSRTEMLALFDAARTGIEPPAPDALTRELAETLNWVGRDVREWCEAVQRESSWDGWDSHFKAFAYDDRDGPSGLVLIERVLSKARAANLVGAGATKPIAEPTTLVPTADDVVGSLATILKPFYQDCKNDDVEVEVTARRTLVEVARAVQQAAPAVHGWDFLEACGLQDSDIVDLVNADGTIKEPDGASITAHP